MKNKPIENPQFYGCLNCSPEQTTIINADRLCDCYGWATLTIDGEIIDLNEKNLTLGEINEVFAGRLKNCTDAEIELYGALHGETFELNTVNGNWYTTKQNQGFV